ncbi:MAG: AMP-forming long-chain acyl-CoA synthetase, partial [Clostridiales bacterium]|nr:AMP-forming long-chain acyl-CoA synthetase [Clostridiales bacterium]
MASDKLYPVRKIRDLKDMFAQSCELFRDKSAFLIKESDKQYKEISYSQFGKDVEAFGTALLELGLGNGLVAVLGENRYEWCATYLSVVNGVGTIVPMDKELPLDEIRNLLNRCEASAIVFSGKYRNQMKNLVGSIPSIRYYIDMDLKQDEEGFLSFSSLMDSGKELINAGDKRFNSVEINPENMSALIFTSGTTDLAKGVMLSHRNICTNLTSVCSTVLIRSEDISLSILPMHHTYECTTGFLIMIYKGGTIAFNEGLKHIPKNLQEVKPTYMVSVPLLLENMYRKIWDKVGKKKLMRFKFIAALFFTNFLYKFLKIDIRKKVFKLVHESFGGSMRLIITGAAAIKPEVSKFFRRLGIQVLQGYGLTECAPLVAGNRDNSFVDSAGGLPIPGTQIKILNP